MRNYLYMMIHEGVRDLDRLIHEYPNCMTILNEEVESSFLAGIGEFTLYYLDFNKKADWNEIIDFFDGNGFIFEHRKIDYGSKQIDAIDFSFNLSDLEDTVIHMDAEEIAHEE